MGLFNNVVDAARLVIADFNSFVIQTHGVLVDVGVHIQIGRNRCAATEFNPVAGNDWLRSSPLHVDSRRFASQNLIVAYKDRILRQRCHHDSSAFEMSERAPFDCQVSIDREYSSSIGIVSSISFKLAVVALQSRLRHCCYARYFLMSFFEHTVQ